MMNIFHSLFIFPAYPEDDEEMNKGSYISFQLGCPFIHDKDLPHEKGRKTWVDVMKYGKTTVRVYLEYTWLRTFENWVWRFNNVVNRVCGKALFPKFGFLRGGLNKSRDLLLALVHETKQGSFTAEGISEAFMYSFEVSTKIGYKLSVLIFIPLWREDKQQKTDIPRKNGRTIICRITSIALLQASSHWRGQCTLTRALHGVYRFLWPVELTWLFQRKKRVYQFRLVCKRPH